MKKGNTKTSLIFFLLGLLVMFVFDMNFDFKKQ
jgi:hypothetical protein